MRREDWRRRFSRQFASPVWGVVLGFLRRGGDLIGELARQAPITLVDLRLHPWVEAEVFGDAFGAHGGLVVHAPWPVGAVPQGAALAVADGGGLDGVLLLLAGDERAASGPVCCGRRTRVSMPSTRRVTPLAAA
jgi:hypothetical protein